MQQNKRFKPDPPRICAGEDVENALGKSRLLREVHDGDGGERGVPRRLYHARATGRDGRSHLKSNANQTQLTFPGNSCQVLSNLSTHTVIGARMLHRKWRETKQQLI